MTLQNSDFKTITELITKARYNALKSVNKELINLYWTIGEYITHKVETTEWGKSVVEKLAEHIQAQFPEIKGFTSRNLWRMKQFYDTYREILILSEAQKKLLNIDYQDSEKLSPTATVLDNDKVKTAFYLLSWSLHLEILSGCKTIEEKLFYIFLSAKEKYTSKELRRQIKTSVFERTMLADTKLSAASTQLSEDITGIFKDTYIFEFLNLPKEHNEKDLQTALTANLKTFILELGKGFTYIGQEYRVQVGMHDYYLDLLFFHRQLQCLVVFELKTEEFQPEFLGKLNFYLEALDRNVRLQHENPSIGILLCKGKDNDVVEYAMSRNLSPAMIADYETKLIPKQLLLNKLCELHQIFDKYNDDE